MESNGMSSVMFSGFSPNMLSLEMPQNQQNPPSSVPFRHPHPYAAAGNPTTADQQTQQPTKLLYPYAAAPASSSKPKQLSPISGGDDDDRGSGSGSGCHPEDSAGTDGKRKFSQWHRMKWTDKMVRLLIMAVFYIGDEAGLGDQIDAKKKSGGGGGGGGGGNEVAEVKDLRRNMRGERIRRGGRRNGDGLVRSGMKEVRILRRRPEEKVCRLSLMTRE